jgi:bacillithiol biosynthesis deacetylase BshB1
MTKINLLAFGAHPDDVELSAGGTIAKHVKMGLSCGIIDLTQGELGTRGNAETRAVEAQNASKILGLSIRENLKLSDGFFEVNQENILAVVKVIRKYQPDIVLANAPNDRHPDHGRGAKLLIEACYLSGLSKIETFDNNEKQNAHRPKNLYHYIQDYYLEPTFLVDISVHFETKKKSINAYSTQFYTPSENSSEPQTPISGKDFSDFLEGRARMFGRSIQVEYAEGFISNKTIGISSLLDLR